MVDQDFKEDNTLIPICKIESYLKNLPLTNREKVWWEENRINTEDDSLVLSLKQKYFTRIIQSYQN